MQWAIGRRYNVDIECNGQKKRRSDNPGFEQFVAAASDRTACHAYALFIRSTHSLREMSAAPCTANLALGQFELATSAAIMLISGC